MSRSALAAAAAVGALAAAAVWWPASPPLTTAAATAPVRSAEAAPAAATAVAPARVPAAAASSVAVAAPRCAGALLVVDHGQGVQHACLGSAAQVQHGDLRTWQATAVARAWRLEVDVDGDTVAAARLAAGGALPLACEGTSCAGITLGPRDAHGQRHLLLRQAAFGSGAQRLQASGDVPLPAHADAAACGDDAVHVVQEGGAAWRFCASAASAVALLDDGRRVFHLRSRAGDALQVTLDAEGALAEITLGALRCSAWSCSGASVAPAADGSSVLALAGVPLRHAQSGARLEGRLALPAP